MKCPKCHSDNPDSSRFCGSCATQLTPEGKLSPTLTKTFASPAHALTKGSLIADKYRIIEEIGRGGMGVVYKAEDIKLKRPIALKFLPPQWVSDPEARERFVQEARAASALDHPNICTIHEIGEAEDDRMFIAMAFYDGESLREKIQRGPLKQEEALDIAIQAATGMAKAHQKGIVHRDIKPANVLITNDGVAKIVDFGVAKLASQINLTREGTTVGTVAYMSPEQARGETVDQRSDIWSLGVVIYETLSGVLPFKGDFEQTLIHSILQREPERLTKIREDLPAGLENIIFKAMAKRPSDRYQTMDELLEDLHSIAEGFKPLQAGSRVFRGSILGVRKVFAYPALAGIVVLAAVALLFVLPKSGQAFSSIAVLPLSNLSGDPAQEYFSEGVHSDLIMELSRIGSIKVINRTSTLSYRGTTKKISAIAKELGASAIVAGSVRIDGKRIKLNVELIDGRSEKNLWAFPFEGEIRNSLSLQSEAALSIAKQIRAALTPEEAKTLTRVRSVNPEAYELYLKGLYHYNKWTKEGMEKAIEYLQGAIKIEPAQAQALATLADAYGWLGFYGYGDRPKTIQETVNSLLLRALAIDETLPEAHRILAHLRFYYDRDWVRAEKELQRAIELNPSYSAAHFSYAWLLISLSRFEKAIVEAKRGQELDPLSIPAIMTVGDVHYYARRYDQAIAQYQKLVEMEPNYPEAYGYLARAYEQKGIYEEAVRARQKELTLTGSLPEEVVALARAYAQQGPKGYWMWRLQKLGGRSALYSPYTTAEFHAHLGNKEEAIALLETAYQGLDSQIVFLNVEPAWDSLRDNPRFNKLIRLMKYPNN